MHERRARLVTTALGMRRLMLPAGVALAVLSSGCRQQHAGNCTAPDASPGVQAAAERAIRAATPRLAVQFRGVQVYAQAAASHWAVCGLVTPFADDPGIFVPFVSLVAPATRAGQGYETEQLIGSSTAEADHVYIALVADCWDRGGPSTGPLQETTPLPPLPDTVREPSAHGAATSRNVPLPDRALAAPTGPDDAGPASGRAIMRQNANLHGSPHGPPVRVVQQGTALRIFAAAPGGWYQVGDASPWGWVHESMIDRR